MEIDVRSHLVSVTVVPYVSGAGAPLVRPYEIRDGLVSLFSDGLIPFFILIFLLISCLLTLPYVICLHGRRSNLAPGMGVKPMDEFNITLLLLIILVLLIKKD